MWVSPEQGRAIVESCGLVSAPEGTAGTHHLEIRIEPVAAAIRIELSGPVARTCAVDVRAGARLWESDGRALFVGAGLASWLPSAHVLVQLFEAFCRYELLSLHLELVAGASGFAAAGVRALCDENAAFRNPRVAELVASTQPEATRRLKALGIDYVKLQGPVGLLSVGAGETMAAMDLLDAAGCPAACFLDVSGGFGVEPITAALRQIGSLPGVRAVLVNVFGGVTRVDRVAESIVAALDQLPGLRAPIVTRLEGTEAERGRSLLAEKRLRSEPTLRGAIDAAVAAARGIAP
jgi:succinyl-CoA synthetase beta subunit